MRNSLFPCFKVKSGKDRKNCGTKYTNGILQ
jgi:hypothetical protein